MEIKALIAQFPVSFSIARNHVIGELISDQAGTLRVELDLSRVSNWHLNQCRTDVVAIKQTDTS